MVAGGEIITRCVPMCGFCPLPPKGNERPTRRQAGKEEWRIALAVIDDASHNGGGALLGAGADKTTQIPGGLDAGRRYWREDRIVLRKIREVKNKNKNKKRNIIKGSCSGRSSMKRIELSAGVCSEIGGVKVAVLWEGDRNRRRGKSNNWQAMRRCKCGNRGCDAGSTSLFASTLE